MKANQLILGTVQFGLSYGINNILGKPDQKVVFDILTEAHNNGINELDCAEAYGDAQSTIGAFIKKYNVPLLVNTKFHCAGVPIANQLEQTLNELNIDKVNTYFYHKYDDFNQHNESLEELIFLKKENKISKIGVSVYDNKQMLHCIETPDVDVIQFPFNLLDNYRKREKVIQLAKQHNKEIQVRSVFLQGLLLKDVRTFPEKLNPLAKYITNLQHLADEHGCSLRDIALAYAFQIPEIDKVLIGIDSLEQLKQNMNALSMPLSNQLMHSINEIDVAEQDLLYPFNWQ